MYVYVYVSKNVTELYTRELWDLLRVCYISIFKKKFILEEKGREEALGSACFQHGAGKCNHEQNTNIPGGLLLQKRG